MSVLPDFGYGRDNYILNQQTSHKGDWNMFYKYLSNPDKFQWLMNYIKLKQIERGIKQEEFE